MSEEKQPEKQTMTLYIGTDIIERINSAAEKEGDKISIKIRPSEIARRFLMDGLVAYEGGEA